MPAKTPATIVTGFLGAGKTTLIRHMLENAGGRRIALIINEFGDLGVDGDLLKGCGDETCSEDDIMELSNGCICCTVAEDFIPTMERLLDRPDAPDHIVIEVLIRRPLRFDRGEVCGKAPLGHGLAIDNRHHAIHRHLR